MEPEAAHRAAEEPADTPHEAAIAADGQRPDEATPTRTAAAAAEGAAAAAAGASPAADRYSDADLDGLALKLDVHSHQLRADLLAHLADCQRRAEERQREAVAAVASSAARELATKEQVVDVLDSETQCLDNGAVLLLPCGPRLQSSRQQHSLNHLPHTPCIRSWPAPPPSWSGSARCCGAQARPCSRRRAGGGSTHWAAWRGGRGASGRPGVRGWLVCFEMQRWRLGGSALPTAQHPVTLMPRHA